MRRLASHSPDLLDGKDIPADSILAVSAAEGRTFIGPVNTAGRAVLRKRLRTPGERLRIAQMEPDFTQVPNPSELPMRLFRQVCPVLPTTAARFLYGKC